MSWVQNGMEKGENKIVIREEGETNLRVNVYSMCHLRTRVSQPSCPFLALRTTNFRETFIRFHFHLFFTSVSSLIL